MSTEDRVVALEERVAVLESALQQSRGAAPAHQSPQASVPPAQVPRTEESTPQDPTPQTPSDDDAFWALEGLRARTPEPGAVMMVGSVQVPSGGEARWQMAAGADELFSSDFADRAESLSALAHPARLRILQQLMAEAETVQDLVGTGEFGTSGQVYHHLRQLTSSGWLRASGGGRYEVPAARVVPLLTILLGVDR
ncbi:ArsR family transcriptional regulator [Nesterenkonia lacusekhoensis]|uniref:DNA-binding transcriptional ArsR family regulator n=1 Tax=Nesterenkonia lacusekhoensis TaxID=150832 RepID=A0ABS4T439_9MICC|nr:helix-turn-helix domain-containing protein [Nesterenkonia lacusekhoensis]MBP2319229.1 DNA-binding transcriptional ArsR family regulator [Nesterenkonia lacusekhoensis]